MSAENQATRKRQKRINAIAPWFGGKRILGSRIAEQLGLHGQYFEPFCASLAVLFAKPRCQKETVSDIHRDVTNLARVIQHEQTAVALYDRLTRTLFCEDLLDAAQSIVNGDVVTLERDINRAYWFFVASWMGRNGTSGTARTDYQIAVRWSRHGGSPTIRWKNAVDSLPWWHERLRDVVILTRDAFDYLHKCEDHEATAIYVDPPYMSESRGRNAGKSSRYLHEFECKQDSLFGDDHTRLAEVLNDYKRARIVVSYYDCERVRKLYKGWTFIECHMHKNLSRGMARSKPAPEVLIVNGPAYSAGPMDLSGLLSGTRSNSATELVSRP